MSNNKGGRPTVMTPEVLAKLEDAFLYGCTDLEACFIAGISKDALYDYCNIHPEFTERKEALKQSPSIRAKRTMVKAIDGGDKDASKWWLERRNKDEFSPKQLNEHTGKDGGAIAVLTSSDQEIINRYINQTKEQK